MCRWHVGGFLFGHSNGTWRNYEHAIANPSAPGHRRSANHRGESGIQLADQAERPPDPERLNALVAAIARVRLMGGRVVLVSSGAIAAGFGSARLRRTTNRRGRPAGMRRRRPRPAHGPIRKRLRTVRSCVSDRSSSPFPTRIAPQQYRNVRRTLESLLDLGAVPIINENDFARIQRNPIRRQRPPLRTHRQHRRRRRARPLTDVDALYTAPQANPARNASPTCRTSKTRWPRFRSAAPAQMWAPVVWSPKWKQPAWRQFPAFPQCSPARRTQARP